MISRIVSWEVFGGRKIYLILFIYFLLIFTSGVFGMNGITIRSLTPQWNISRDASPGSVIDLDWTASQMWWLLYPVVTAYTVYQFSYEVDKGIIRTYLLSRVRKSTLFAAKLLSLFISVILPTLVSLLVVYPLGDPILFMADPLTIYTNFPKRLLIYLSMIYIMLGFSIFFSNLFRRPIYAFATPILIVYVLNAAPVEAIWEYVPPSSYMRLGHIVGVPENIFLSKFTYVIPSIFLATVGIIAAFLIFVLRDYP